MPCASGPAAIAAPTLRRGFSEACGSWEHHLDPALHRHRPPGGERDAAGVGAHQAGHTAPQRRFPRSRFAHQAERFAAMQHESGGAHGVDARAATPRPAAGGIGLAQPAHFEHARRVARHRARAAPAVGHRRDEAARIGMGGRGQHPFERPGLDHLAVEHHGQVVADLRGHAEIVRDEQQGGAASALHRAQVAQDLRLGRDVERGGRLVGDQ